VKYYIVWQGREVSYFSQGRRVSPKTEIAFPHEPHILFFVTPLQSSVTAKIMQGSMQQLDHNSTTIFHGRNDLVLLILSFTQGGYNMNIRYNQKFMFCKEPMTVV